MDFKEEICVNCEHKEVSSLKKPCINCVRVLGGPKTYTNWEPKEEKLCRNCGYGISESACLVCDSNRHSHWKPVARCPSCKHEFKEKDKPELPRKISYFSKSMDSITVELLNKVNQILEYLKDKE